MRGSRPSITTAHLAALAPLGPHLKELGLRENGRCPAGTALGEAAASAILTAVPRLQKLSLCGYSSPPLAAAVLHQLVTGLPRLQQLNLHLPLRSPADVVAAALAAERQAQEAQRTQPMVIEVGRGEGVLLGGAAAVRQLLAQGGVQLAHVQVKSPKVRRGFRLVDTDEGEENGGA